MSKVFTKILSINHILLNEFFFFSFLFNSFHSDFFTQRADPFSFFMEGSFLFYHFYFTFRAGQETDSPLRSGMEILNLLPFPGSLSIYIFPFRTERVYFTMESPRPSPPISRHKGSSI